MSTIAAGTTSTTALVSTGDTTGNLVFQTNGTTTAMTIDTSQNVGIGTSSPGTYGKFVTYSSGGYGAINSSGQLLSYQLLDVATAGGRLIGGSNQGVLGEVGIEQTTTGAKGGYIRLSTCASGSNSPTDRVLVTSDGYLRMASGTGGIQFGGDTAAANALDDYEEGTWTPTLNTGIPGSPSPVVSSADCRYVKIGSFVQASAYFVAANDGTTIQIGGLPFTSFRYSSFSLGHQSKTVSFERIDNGVTVVSFTLSGTSGTNQEFYFSINYLTS